MGLLSKVFTAFNIAFTSACYLRSPHTSLHMLKTRLALIYCILLVRIGATAQGNITYYPPNMYADTAHYPFIYGVASGDPDTNSVLLWTKVAVTNISTSVGWSIASDSNFTNVLDKGVANVSPDRDFCVKVKARNLSPDMQYYYRFTYAGGKTSVIGKARTLPKQDVTNVRFAVVSCSSVWSGYFNAYRKIAERKDIDFLVHLGDYAYDYVDEDEKFRVPQPYPVDVSNLREWRERHAYYLLDPDLRLARQNLTWITQWDNHDIDVESKDPADAQGGIQAFYEYLPVAMPDTTHPEYIYRTFNFGKLIELNVIDMHSFRGKEEFEPGKKCVLGATQHDWLLGKLGANKAQWSLIANQEMMSDWLSEGAPKFVKLPGNGRVFDPSNWNGFPEDRSRIYNFICEHKLNNVVVMTGDAHMSFIMDLTDTPKDKKKYKKKSGEGGIGVEFVTPSITRGNFDESGLSPALANIAKFISKSINPHHIYNQFTKHGYVVVDVNTERTVAEFWYTDILKLTEKETFNRGYTVKSGDNHWTRKPNKRIKKSSKYNFGQKK